MGIRSYHLNAGLLFIWLCSLLFVYRLQMPAGGRNSNLPINMPRRMPENTYYDFGHVMGCSVGGRADDVLQQFLCFQQIQRNNDTDDPTCRIRRRRRMGPRNQRRVMLVRNPLERFAHEFVVNCAHDRPDQWDCYGCRTDIRCFLKNFAKRVKALAAGKFLIAKYDMPFLPQTWFCDIQRRFRRYDIVQMDRKYMKKPMDALLERIDRVIDQRSNFTTHIRQVVKKTISENSHLMGVFNTIYDMDYTYFNYTRITT